MATNRMHIPDLEACIDDKYVTILYSGQDGITKVTGLPLKLQVPWSIELLVDTDKVGATELRYTESYDFAGIEGGILMISSNGTKLYDECRIPVPYPVFRDPIMLNDFRRALFGEEYEIK
jgi:hypothetical protein